MIFGKTAKPSPDAAHEESPSSARDWRLLAPRELFQSPHRIDWEGQCRRMAQAIYLGDHTMLCRTLARFKMYVSTLDHGLAPHLMSDGFWELWITRAMVRAVQPGMVCIDAGANIGYYSLLLADLTGAEGKVLASEPMPSTREYLERNVSINGFDAIVEITGAAFGAHAGEVTLYMPPGEPKNALICETPPHPDWESAKVALTAIDDLMLPQVDFVKIDVEGAEIEVWKGLRNTIAANPGIQIMMEVNCRRYPDRARAFIDEIGTAFPLRLIDYEGDVRLTTAGEVLSSPNDVMLYLRRSGQA